MTRRRLVVALLLVLFALPALAAEPAQAARATAEQWLRDQYATSGARVVAQAGTLDPRLQLAPCPATLSASLQEGTRLMPRMNVTVRCPGADGWTLRVPVQLQVFRQVFVIARPLQRGDGVRPDDVRSEERDVTRLGYGYVSDMGEVEGRTLSRAMAAGSVLTPAALGGRTAVKAGDQVQLVSRLDGIEVRASGVALGSGDSGSRLRVRNGSSGKVIDGMVIAPGEVLALP
ncbi:flagellar basal body P-ring formation chaperone FlgA [Dyella jiangningensis]|uniref:flagellar basal body P-ring formation chaperone FlgA n=1 Tax=Dyella jiangningensis TaxID=1379159 RepID=UPI00240FB228|nr:flagellar basal body P-ring formation chaperone FlgA [Dyella jiangningensis]MDG2538159.1 flagellar basal body P-ring formation chaperone FlgA [Dyella jiangningensis]